MKIIGALSSALILLALSGCVGPPKIDPDNPLYLKNGIMAGNYSCKGCDLTGYYGAPISLETPKEALSNEEYERLWWKQRSLERQYGRRDKRR